MGSPLGPGRRNTHENLYLSPLSSFLEKTFCKLEWRKAEESRRHVTSAGQSVCGPAGWWRRWQRLSDSQRAPAVSWAQLSVFQASLHREGAPHLFLPQVGKPRYSGVNDVPEVTSVLVSDSPQVPL